jgi:hypothetical protein
MQLLSKLSHSVNLLSLIWEMFSSNLVQDTECVGFLVFLNPPDQCRDNILN